MLLEPDKNIGITIIIKGIEKAIIYCFDSSGNPVRSGNMATKKIKREKVFNTF